MITIERIAAFGTLLYHLSNRGRFGLFLAEKTKNILVTGIKCRSISHTYRSLNKIRFSTAPEREKLRGEPFSKQDISYQHILLSLRLVKLKHLDKENLRRSGYIRQIAEPHKNQGSLKKSAKLLLRLISTFLSAAKLTTLGIAIGFSFSPVGALIGAVIGFSQFLLALGFIFLQRYTQQQHAKSVRREFRTLYNILTKEGEVEHYSPRYHQETAIKVNHLDSTLSSDSNLSRIGPCFLHKMLNLPSKKPRILWSIASHCLKWSGLLYVSAIIGFLSYLSFNVSKIFSLIMLGSIIIDTVVQEIATAKKESAQAQEMHFIREEIKLKSVSRCRLYVRTLSPLKETTCPSPSIQA